jgi:hypothetical protein
MALGWLDMRLQIAHICLTLAYRARRMQLDLTDEEAFALLKLLTEKIENDRYPLSPRIRVLRSIRDKLPGAPPAAPAPDRSHRGSAIRGERLDLGHAGVEANPFRQLSAGHKRDTGCCRCF